MASLYRMELSQLKGVGAKTAGLFSKLGLQSVGALLRFYPRDYENWSETVPIASAPFGEISIIKAEVASPVETTRLSGGRLMCKTLVTDGETDLILTFFNNRFIPNQLHQGNTYLFRGKIGGTFFRREMVSPQIMREGANIPIRPVYSQTEGLKSNQIARAASQALALLPDPLEDPIPPQIREKYGLCDLRSALFMIHTPNSIAEIETARRRLVFEELLYLRRRFLPSSAVRSDGSAAAQCFRNARGYAQRKRHEPPPPGRRRKRKDGCRGGAVLLRGEKRLSERADGADGNPRRTAL